MNGEKRSSFEELEKKIHGIIERMKDPEVDLTVSADLYQEGQAVLQEMEKTLKQLQEKLGDEQE